MQQTKTKNKQTGASSLEARMKIIIYCLFGIMFFFAISSTMTGILVPDLTETYHLNSMQIGLIGSVQSVGSMVAMVFGGVLSDRFSKLRLIALFFAIYTVVLYLIGMVPAFVVLLVLYVLMGVANSYLNLLLSAFISEAYGEKRTTYLNMIHAFYSLGSLAGPVYATMVQKSGQHWNTSFVNLGILCTVITVIFLAIIAPVKVEAKKGDSGNTIREAVKLLSNRKLQLLAILCCAYMGHQSLICLWISTYAQNGLGLSADIGSNSLILFWAGVVLGRFSQPVIDKRMDYRRWLQYTCLIAAILYTASFIIGNGVFLVVTLFLVGAMTGAAFPTIIGMACSLYPQFSGTATSAVSLASSVSGTILSWLIGVLVEKAGYLTGMMIIPVLLVLCSIILAVIIGPQKKKA